MQKTTLFVNNCDWVKVIWKKSVFKLPRSVRKSFWGIFMYWRSGRGEGDRTPWRVPPRGAPQSYFLYFIFKHISQHWLASSQTFKHCQFKNKWMLTKICARKAVCCTELIETSSIAWLQKLQKREFKSTGAQNISLPAGARYPCYATAFMTHCGLTIWQLVALIHALVCPGIKEWSKHF